jgi:hypothetical protein
VSEWPSDAAGVPVSRAEAMGGLAARFASGKGGVWGDSAVRSGNGTGTVMGEAKPGGWIVELAAAGFRGGLGAGFANSEDGGFTGAKDSASDHGSGRMVAKTFR